MTQLEYIDYLKRKLDNAGITYRKLNRYDDEAQLFERQKAEIASLKAENELLYQDMQTLRIGAILQQHELDDLKRERR